LEELHSIQRQDGFVISKGIERECSWEDYRVTDRSTGRGAKGRESGKPRAGKG
jgi:hypothetical protein